MQTNPYKIGSPASVCFSGGRTSGKMLHEILAAYDGKLPPDVHVAFENTGMEQKAIESLSVGLRLRSTPAQMRAAGKTLVNRTIARARKAA